MTRRSCGAGASIAVCEIRVRWWRRTLRWVCTSCGDLHEQRISRVTTAVLAAAGVRVTRSREQEARDALAGDTGRRGR